MNGKVIAIIDDEKEAIDMVSKYLSERGFIVNGFRSPKEFFGYLEKNMPDLVLLDLIFPNQMSDGYSVCKHMVSDKNLSEIPVIVLSARSSEEDKVYCLDLGADDYLVKPVALEELKCRIEKTLERREAIKTERELRRIKEGEIEEGKEKMATMIKVTVMRENKMIRLKKIIEQLSLNHDGPISDHESA
ncbi:MAG: response regulator [Candidatus Omnitrophota bacterium]|nr:response regulator [Candidatus Omnitrophota bacterium]